MSIAVKTDTGWQVLGGGAPGELPGIGGWATITSVWNGSGTKPNRYTYGDWVAYEWKGTRSNSNTTGSLTVGTDGLIDVLCIGAGNANTHSSLNSDGGHLVAGNLWATAGNHSVQAGHAGLNGSYNNDRSYLSGICGVIRCTGIGNGGAGSYLTTGQTDAGFRSSITGTEVEYGPAGNPNAIGGGQSKNTPTSAAGVGAVIVRVPAAQAAGVPASEYVDVP